MVLSLIDPLGSNFLKDFPGQNLINLDKIDAAAGPSLATQPLRSFVPTFIGGGGLNPYIGTDGVNIAYYYKIWDHVYAWGEVIFGAGWTVGLGTYILELPFEYDSFLNLGSGISSSPVVGQGWVQDASSSAGRLPLTVHQRETNRLMFGVRLESSAINRDLRDSGYITWAQGDGFIWNAQFKVKETP